MAENNRAPIWRPWIGLALYLVIGTLWVLVGETWLADMAVDKEHLEQYQMWKGWLYVLFTGTLAWWLMRRALRADRIRVLAENKTMNVLRNAPVGIARIVYFDFDSFVVKPEYQSVLEGHARYLKASSARKVMIEGHTDERGGREYNLALGQKRAEAVRRSLALLGVADAQMEAVSFGKEKPAAQGHGEDAHSQNRRAELSYR